MKTFLGLLSLVTLATAVPITFQENLNEHEVEGLSAIKVREKKSPLDDLSDGLQTNHQEDEFKPSLLEKRNLVVKKPIIVKKKFGYHVYRDSDEEMAHADPHENCSSQVKVKLCNSEPILHTHLFNENSEQSSGIVLEKEMEHSIRMAKEAVENLQRDLWKMEQNSIKVSNSKENLRSDLDLQQDIENARKVLEHIQHSIGKFESIDFQPNTPTNEEAETLSSKDEERLKIWKEAIENIHKNFEIARNIEDAFNSDGQTLPNTDHKDLENFGNIEPLAKNNEKLQLKPDVSVHINGDTMPLTSTDKNNKNDNSKILELTTQNKETNQNEDISDMFVSPTNLQETKMNLQSDSLISENMLKETIEDNNDKDIHENNRFKSSVVLPQFDGKEEISDKGELKPIDKETSDLKMVGQQGHAEKHNSGIKFENEEPFRFNHERLTNEPFTKNNIQNKDDSIVETKTLSDKKLMTQPQADLVKLKESLTDGEQKNTERQFGHLSSSKNTNENKFEINSNKNVDNDEEKNDHFRNDPTSSKQQHLVSKASEAAQDTDNHFDLTEAIATSLPHEKQESLHEKSSGLESGLNEKLKNPNQLLRMNENPSEDNSHHESHETKVSNLHKHNEFLNSLHKETEEHFKQDNEKEEFKTVLDPHHERHMHHLNEHSSDLKEKSNNVELQLFENSGLQNSFMMPLNSRPQSFHHQSFDHSSQFFKTDSDTNTRLMQRPHVPEFHSRHSMKSNEFTNQHPNIREQINMRVKENEKLNQQIADSLHGELMHQTMKSNDFFNQHPQEQLNKHIRDHNIQQKSTDNNGLSEPPKIGLESHNTRMMTNSVKSTGFHNQHDSLKEQMSTRMIHDQNLGEHLTDSLDPHELFSMRWAQENIDNQHSRQFDPASVFDQEHEMSEHLHGILPQNRNNNNLDLHSNHDLSPLRSRTHNNMHFIDQDSPSDTDSAMQPSMHFGMRDSEIQWINHHGMARSNYPSSLPIAGSSPGAVGVFPNANTGCGIPLLLSCSPSVVSGSLAKPHPSPISAPAYRSGDDFMYYMKRDAKHIDGLPNFKIHKTSKPHAHKTEMMFKQV